jgi:hypothetical protein
MWQALTSAKGAAVIPKDACVIYNCVWCSLKPSLFEHKLKLREEMWKDLGSAMLRPNADQHSRKQTRWQDKFQRNFGRIA